MDMGYLAGIDLGTSSVKVLIMDPGGRTLAVSSRGYDVMTPKMSYAEQEPQVWWDCTVMAIREAMEKSGIRPEELDCIGLSGQMHGLVAFDRNNEPVMPAIIWMDQRSAKETARIKELAGDLLETELLNQPGAGMMICSLLWLKRHQPDVYDRIAHVMLPKDYIRYRLTGTIGSEYSDACATLAFSVKGRCWCMELIRRAGLKKDIWPQVGESSQAAGPVWAEAAARTGLSGHTRVVYGAGDSSAQLTGNGVIEEGIMACNIGTASQLAAVVDRPLYDTQMRLQTWCHTMADRWYVQGGALNGGSTLSWLKKKVLRDGRSYGELDAEAGQAPAGAEGLLFIPYLAGERTPFMDPYAKGIYFGMGMKHEQAHMIRATMEGVIFNLKECALVLDEMGIQRTKMIASGGAAKGVTWKQIQADILEMPVYTTKTEEEACQGAAILAAVGCGMYRDIKEACSQIVKINDCPVEPVMEHVKRYREQQALFRELYLKVKDLYPRIKTE